MDKILTNIKERILYIAELKGISKEKFIENLNQKYANYKGISKNSAPSSEVLAEISTKYPDVNLDWILTGKGDELKKPNIKEKSSNETMNKTMSFSEETKNIKKIINLNEPSTDYKGIPLIPIEAMAGFGSGNVQVMDYDTKSYVVPEFTELNVDFMLRVKGSSMYPKYNSGDLVACKKLSLNDIFFQWNKVYVLDTDQGALIKRIKKGREDHLMIVSDNPSYDPYELQLSQIHAIALVVGVIRLE